MEGLVEILKIDDNGVVIPSVECYTEPYLKAVMDFYEDPIPALTYLYYRTYPFSKYNNFPLHKRDDAIIAIYPGEYSLEDDVLVEARDQLLEGYKTPITYFYESQKHVFNELSKFNFTVNATSLDAGDRGDLKTIQKGLLDSSKTARAFQDLENEYKKQLQSRIRGGLDEAYDANDET